VRSAVPPRKAIDSAEHERVVAAFLDAVRGGDLAQLVSLLDPDVVVRSDGGGLVPAARELVFGPDRVAALLIGLGRRYDGIRLRPVSVAGTPGFLLLSGDQLIGVASLEVAGGRLTEANLVLSPVKLRTVRFSTEAGAGQADIVLQGPPARQRGTGA